MTFWYGSRHPVQQLRRELDRLWSGFAENVGHMAEGAWSLAGRGRPPVNIWEEDDAVRVELEVPGVKADQLELSVTGQQLAIRIERPSIEEPGVTYHRRERPVGTFHRVVRLPVPVDTGRVEAELRQGVLTITLAKTEAAKARRIYVSGSG
ncbi:MAG TPA: Hsp20/alpha crystallin family protein [Planctomycetaceae bacterium]|nr:Hsp20/alpha crystallin family protein [Planctomycetaceae bacterium]HIQ21911.1 Hsp20/alpha crystallin family protein [Planctomycetota bacterium]